MQKKSIRPTCLHAGQYVCQRNAHCDHYRRRSCNCTQRKACTKHDKLINLPEEYLRGIIYVSGYSCHLRLHITNHITSFPYITSPPLPMYDKKGPERVYCPLRPLRYSRGVERRYLSLYGDYLSCNHFGVTVVSGRQCHRVGSSTIVPDISLLGLRCLPVTKIP